MTFSNIGPAQVREELKDSIEGFQLLVGASPKQRMKCGAVAYDGKLCLSFTSAMAENRLPEFFFHFLEEKGIRVERESNGITDTEHDKGRYPVIAQDRERVRRAVRDFMCHWCSYRFWRGLRIWRLIIGFRLNGRF